MDWLKGLNEAMKYIEENLEGAIDLDTAAKRAYCSSFWFQRMFSYLTDLPLSEYIRRRRMTKAALDIRSGEKVIDVALKYGYNSPTAFNRAFRSVHGIAPSEAKREGVSLIACPPLVFSITVKGEEAMNYRIEHHSAFRILGQKTHFTNGIEESFQKVPSIWKEEKEKGIIPRLCELMDGVPDGILGVCTSAPEKEFDYYIAVASTKPRPHGLSDLLVPESDWALFECTGPIPQAIQNMQKRIVSEWLPTSGYQYAECPDLERYFAEEDHAEIWIPVVRK